jgi:DNA-binding MarR family transcriptional regulator
MPSRAELVGRVSEGIHLASAYAVLTQQSIADRLSLIPTDLRCLEAVRREPRLTAGRLAEITGMSTSATTAALDRLERRGFIRRLRDDVDRRRVFVVSTGQLEEESTRLLAPVDTVAAEIMERYDDAQLMLIADFLDALNAAQARLLDHPSAPAH